MWVLYDSRPSPNTYIRRSFYITKVVVVVVVWLAISIRTAAFFHSHLSCASPCACG